MDKRAEWELTIARLNVAIKPCVRHNNPAHINERRWAEKIVCDACRCEAHLDDHPTWEEAVEAWNDRPYLDRLMEQYIQEVAENAKKRRMYDLLLSHAKRMGLALKKMGKENLVNINDLREAYLSAEMVGRIEEEKKEEWR